MRVLHSVSICKVKIYNGTEPLEKHPYSLEGFLPLSLHNIPRSSCGEPFIPNIKGFYHINFIMQLEITLTQHHPCCLIQFATHVIKLLRNERVALSPVSLHE